MNKRLSLADFVNGQDTVYLPRDEFVLFYVASSIDSDGSNISRAELVALGADKHIYANSETMSEKEKEYVEVYFFRDNDEEMIDDTLFVFQYNSSIGCMIQRQTEETIPRRFLNAFHKKEHILYYVANENGKFTAESLVEYMKERYGGNIRIG